MRIHANSKKHGERTEDESSAALVYMAGLILTASLILFFGLAMLYSTSYGTAGASYFIKQFIWGCVGTLGATLIVLIGYKKVSDWSIPLILFTMLLLFVADFMFPAVKGAHRWIKIPHIGNIQPSEFAKLALVLFMSKHCAENMRYINDIFNKNIIKGLGPVAVFCGPMMALVLLGKDLGTTCLLVVVAVLILFAAGLKLRWILPPMVMAPIGLFMLIKAFDPERWSRLTTFLDPEKCQESDGYQLWNSLLALGSGNWTGLGFNESRMKARYLPEAHTDFILSIVGEELGFASLCAVIIGYIILMFFALKISINARTRQGMLLGFGVTAVLIFQACVNIGVVSGGFPTKGMPAPFISYGGSNLVMCLLGMGLLLSVGMESVSPDFNKVLWHRTKELIAKLHPGNWLKI